MRQVPQYAIIGDGQVARHISIYFNALSIAYRRWFRSAHHWRTLKGVLDQSSHVLLLISDEQIAQVAERIRRTHPNLTMIHFSGSLLVPGVHWAHPLQTFVQSEPFSITEYQKIPFVISKQGPLFESLLPGVPNFHTRIADEDKGYYHALCVMASNFSSLFWGHFFEQMGDRFDLQSHLLLPYFEKTFQNISQAQRLILTGPLKRKDRKTLMNDLGALKGDIFENIFKQFIDTFLEKEI